MSSPGFRIDSGVVSDLLKIAFIGSVDDGKSTLIGRLFFDMGSIPEDQVEDLRRSSKRRGEDRINLALLTDGLKAEREQGITIDIAHRYFTSGARRFILVDCPGHFQYTRNMITGCSSVDAVVVLIDAVNGITEQTRRHLMIASLLRIRHFILCVNKMDLVGYSKDRFEALRAEGEELGRGLGIEAIRVIPVNALEGDNVVSGSLHMPWYEGAPLLSILEGLELSPDEEGGFRFPVQRVVRPNADLFPGFRGYAGRVARGSVRLGDRVIVASSGLETRIQAIHQYDAQDLPVAHSSMSVILTLQDDLDISRGDLLCAGEAPQLSSRVDLLLCWLSPRPAQSGETLWIKHAHRYTQAKLGAIERKLDLPRGETIVDGAPLQTASPLSLNEIALTSLRLSQPLAYDPYARSRTTGSLILIDPRSNQTLAAGILLASAQDYFRSLASVRAK